MNCPRLYFPVALLVLTALPVQADVMYQCIDESGNKSLSNKPPANGAKCTAITYGLRPPIDLIRIGDQTNHGLVIEIRLPIAKVQSADKERWVRVEELKKLPKK